MIDMTKQYTYNGKPVRIYAEGSDTCGGCAHGAFYDDEAWHIATFRESELVEVWQPKEGEIVYMWDKIENPISISIRRFNSIDEYDMYCDERDIGFKYCAKFTGTLPDAFKGIVND